MLIKQNKSSLSRSCGTSPLNKGRSLYGFSLLELLVVISIISVLMAVLTTNFMGMRERARDAQKIQDLNSIKSALRMFYNDNQSYPTGTSLNGLDPNYLPSIGSIGYTYAQTNSGDGFILTVGLEIGAGSDDIDSQTKCGISPAEDKVFAVCAN